LKIIILFRDSPFSTKTDLFGKSYEDKDAIVTSLFLLTSVSGEVIKHFFLDYIIRKIKHGSQSRVTERAKTKLHADTQKLYADPPAKGVLMVFHGAPLASNERFWLKLNLVK
jgi:hypothetical protein